MKVVQQAEPRAAPTGEFSVGETAVELAVLLEKNKLGQFVKALSDEGYDYIEGLLTLPESDQHSLMQTVQMKPGHVCAKIKKAARRICASKGSKRKRNEDQRGDQARVSGRSNAHTSTRQAMALFCKPQEVT